MSSIASKRLSVSDWVFGRKTTDTAGGRPKSSQLSSDVISCPACSTRTAKEGTPDAAETCPRTSVKMSLSSETITVVRIWPVKAFSTVMAPPSVSAVLSSCWLSALVMRYTASYLSSKLSDQALVFPMCVRHVGRRMHVQSYQISKPTKWLCRKRTYFPGPMVSPSPILTNLFLR